MKTPAELAHHWWDGLPPEQRAYHIEHLRELVARMKEDARVPQS